MLTFIILYNNLIPISLIVTIEVVKFQQAQLINSDLDMYYPPTDTPAVCRTSSLVEELGQIQYIFSDKTGTLTRNEMEFRMCSIAGIAYADVVDENRRGDDGEDAQGWRTFKEMQDMLHSRSRDDRENTERRIVNEFLTLLAVCHTVIPEVQGEKTVYQASSPDEVALVAGAELLGYRFHVSACGTALRCMLLTPCAYRPGSRSLFISMSTESVRNTRFSTCASSTRLGSGCRRLFGDRMGRSNFIVKARIL